MEYSTEEKLEWIVYFIYEFGKKYDLTMKQALAICSGLRASTSLTITMAMHIHNRSAQW